MKCVICQGCGEAIPHGDVLFKIDSIFEQETRIVCVDCAQAYHDGYPDAVKSIQKDEYESLKWVDVISDWRSYYNDAARTRKCRKDAF